MFPLHIVSVVCVDVAGGFAAESKETEDLTGNGSGSKHCEFQGCPNLFYYMCLFMNQLFSALPHLRSKPDESFELS